MLSLTPAFRALLAADVLYPVLLLTLREGTRTVRLALADADVQYDGETWSSDHRLVGLTVPEGQQELGRDQYALQFAGLRTSAVAGITWTGLVELSVWFLLRDSDGGLSTGHWPVYHGFLSTQQTGTTDGALVFTAGFAGDLNDVTYHAPYVLTEAGQARRGEGDTSLRYIASTSELRWGRGRE